MSRLQAETGQSYKNIQEAIKIAKRSLKQIPEEWSLNMKLSIKSDWYVN